VTYQEWTTICTECGQGRVTYHSEWDKSKPWASYTHGTAGRHFADLESARIYFAQKGMKLTTKGTNDRKD